MNSYMGIFFRLLLILFLTSCAGYKFKTTDNTRETLKALYVDLIDPISDWIEPYDDLGIIPHGPLHFLPFQALISLEEEFLVQNKNIFVVPSASIYHFSSKMNINE